MAGGSAAAGVGRACSGPGLALARWNAAIATACTLYLALCPHLLGLACDPRGKKKDWVFPHEKPRYQQAAKPQVLGGFPRGRTSNGERIEDRELASAVMSGKLRHTNRFLRIKSYIHVSVNLYPPTGPNSAAELPGAHRHPCCME